MLQKRVLLVGLGLHAERIYLHYLQTSGARLAYVIELASQRKRVEDLLAQRGFSGVQILSIPDEERDREVLSARSASLLDAVVEKDAVDKVIISTEPKAHMAYARYFLKKGIDVLVDKPLSAPVGASHQEKAARQIYADYQELQKILTSSPTTTCTIQSQRRYHWGYAEVLKQLDACLERYQVPVTHASIYHSDGLWSMPNEYQERENHPYKYGYGKLLHSGYHFIDLFSILTEKSRHIAGKEPDTLALAYQQCLPNDCIAQLGEQEYRKVFAGALDGFFSTYAAEQYRSYGEVDAYIQLQLKKGDCVMTTASLNLLQNGFSRRAWPQLPRDTYKGNGRIRQEQVILQVGPLMSIHVHSYESYEQKDRGKALDPYSVGGIEHFDIYIFRNSEILGGSPVEVITNRDYQQKAHSLGHNEEARENCLQEFLAYEGGKLPVSDLRFHDFTNLLLSEILVASSRKNTNPIAGLATTSLKAEEKVPVEYSLEYEELV